MIWLCSWAETYCILRDFMILSVGWFIPPHTNSFLIPRKDLFWLLKLLVVLLKFLLIWDRIWLCFWVESTVCWGVYDPKCLGKEPLRLRGFRVGNMKEKSWAACLKQVCVAAVFPLWTKSVMFSELNFEIFLKSSCPKLFLIIMGSFQTQIITLEFIIPI